MSTELNAQEITTPTTETHSDNTAMAALAYLFGFVTGIIVYLVAAEDRFARFHAAQSIALSAVLTVAYIAMTAISFVAAFLGDFVFVVVSLVMLLAWLVLGLGGFVLWLYMMISAYQGKTVRLPVAAGIADRIVGSGGVETEAVGRSA